MAEWPSELPSRPRRDSIQHETIEPVIRSAPELGTPMARSRASVEFEVMVGTFVLDTDEFANLKRFWRTDCGRGATNFNADHWITGERVNMRFGAAPKVEAHLGPKVVGGSRVVDVFAVTVAVHTVP